MQEIKKGKSELKRTTNKCWSWLKRYLRKILPFHKQAFDNALYAVFKLFGYTKHEQKYCLHP